MHAFLLPFLFGRLLLLRFSLHFSWLLLLASTAAMSAARADNFSLRPPRALGGNVASRSSSLSSGAGGGCVWSGAARRVRQLASSLARTLRLCAPVPPPRASPPLRFGHEPLWRQSCRTAHHLRLSLLIRLQSRLFGRSDISSSYTHQLQLL